MFNISRAIVRSRVERYLIDSAFDYAADCLEKENPTEKEIKRFVVNDIKRVMTDRWGNPTRLNKKAMVIDYLQGLLLNVAFSYYDEWQKLNEWTGEENDIQKATDEGLAKVNDKYWHLLGAEICRWGM